MKFRSQPSPLCRATFTATLVRAAGVIGASAVLLAPTVSSALTIVDAGFQNLQGTYTHGTGDPKIGPNTESTGICGFYGGVATACGSAAASPFVYHVTSSANGFGTMPPMTTICQCAEAFGNAGFTDVLDITGGTGNGTLDISMTYDGRVTIGGIPSEYGGGVGFYSMVFACTSFGGCGGPPTTILNSGVGSWGSNSFGEQGTDILVAQIPFTFGTPLDISAYISSVSEDFPDSQNNSYGGITNDLNETAYLEPFVVLNADGTLNRSAEVTSLLNGLVYPVSVPETPIWVLLLTGIASLGGALRRRRSISGLARSLAT